MVDNSMFEFSWPYILQQKVKSKVINHALSGHGNDRIFREVYRIVESDDFKTSENLFLFELVRHLPFKSSPNLICITI